MEDFINTVAIILFAVFCVIAAPFVVLHVMNNWDKPSYPHSGFSPEHPTWEAPEENIPAYTRRK